MLIAMHAELGDLQGLLHSIVCAKLTHELFLLSCSEIILYCGKASRRCQ